MISIFQVDLILDFEIVYLNFIILKDRKSVIYRMMKLNCFDNFEVFIFYLVVLSCEGFDVGRYFWQVEIRGIGEWCLGVCKNFFRNVFILLCLKDVCG